MSRPDRKPKALPHPFATLMGMAPIRLPKTPKATLVLEGKVIHSARDIQAENDLWHPADQALAQSERKRLRTKLLSVQQAAGYQRDRQSTQPEAKPPSWNERHADERKAYMAAYRADPANRARKNASALAWQKRAYAADPEKYRQRALAYYAAHRDEILARAAAKRKAKREAQRLATAQAQAQAQEANPTPTETAERTET